MTKNMELALILSLLSIIGAFAQMDLTGLLQGKLSGNNIKCAFLG
jgi:hypothetical protein